MKIESKEKARARGVPSPDRAEALMLALCKPPQRYEYYSIRDLGGRLSEQGRQSGPYDRPNHDDDLDAPNVRRIRWPWNGLVGPLTWRRGGGIW